MAYEINQAISYCNITTGKSKKDIRDSIIIELGGDPENPSDQVLLSKKISGQTKRITQEQFISICKACNCPAYVLAGMEQ